jgi:hypothetical protein
MIELELIVNELEEVDAQLWHIADWRIEISALHTEIGEFQNELPWRPWRQADQRPITEKDRERALKELGDIFGTAIRIAMHVGYTGEDIELAIRLHVKEKQRRVKEGIDG